MNQNLSTHELAYQLRRLATALLNGPDVPLGQLSKPMSVGVRDDIARPSAKRRKKGAGGPDLIKVIAELSSVKKSEWLDLLDRASIPLTFRPRDAARDVLGRLFVFLKDNPDARERLRGAVESDTRTRAKSTQLSDALRTLLDLS
jgi:hypothetical protein